MKLYTIYLREEINYVMQVEAENGEDAANQACYMHNMSQNPVMDFDGEPSGITITAIVG